MSLIVPDAGEVAILDMLVAGDGFGGVWLKLFKNNLTPDQNTVLGDFTEADFSGYAALQPSFGSAAIVSHKGKIVDTASRDFTHNGGGTANTVYGYYVVDLIGGRILWAERFAAPQLITNNGDTISITAAFTGDSEF